MVLPTCIVSQDRNGRTTGLAQDEHSSVFCHVIQSCSSRHYYLSALSHRHIRHSLHQLASLMAQVQNSHHQKPVAVRVLEPQTKTVMETSEMFMLGTGPYCNLQFQSRYVSRVQLVIIPANEWYFLVDLGSTNGTVVTFYNQQHQEQQITLNRQYPVWKFPQQTFVRLDMVCDLVAPVYLNCKYCVICEAKPRSSRLPCGHACMCSECSLQLQACPICRENYNTAVETQQLDANLTYIEPARRVSAFAEL